MTVTNFTNSPITAYSGIEGVFNNAFHLNVRSRALSIYLTPKSGKIIYRNKIDTLIGIIHPGIVLGQDRSGVTWVIHNHYKIGHPEIVTLEEFADGVDVLEDTRILFYNASEIVKRSIESWKEKKEYSWLFNNCQHFVNKVAMGKPHSEAIDKIGNGGLAIGGLLSLYGAFTNNRGLLKVGLAVGGAGLGIKVINR